MHDELQNPMVIIEVLSHVNQPGTFRNLLRLRDVQAVTGLSRRAIYDLASRCHFPPPIKIGPRTSAWVAVEVDAWIECKIAERFSL